jgi:hypothetical protein
MNMLAKRVCITIYPEEWETLRKKAKESGLPLSRYLVLRALNKLAVK